MKRTLLTACAASALAFSPAFAQDAAAPADHAPKVVVDKSQPPRVAAYTSFAPIVDKIAPSVVRVSISKTVQAQTAIPPQWRRFFRGGGGGEGEAGREAGLGSGVIVSADGYIVTNNHVTEGADDIKVSIGSDPKEYTAKRVGSDSGTDIAVLKIDAKNLPAATFADSDKARVGDIVLAVGNPFNLTQTVTMGIISGLGRDDMMNANSYQNFIQTDASINPGNSGGALVDTEGRVVGINTAILSRSGGNEGIGLAVPSNLVRVVLQSIREKGKVVRGLLGTRIQPLTPELADVLKLKSSSGALVSEVNPDSPAEKAGLEDGDVIVSVNGTKVDDGRMLHLMIGGIAPGTQVNLKYIRDGKEQVTQATLAEMPAQGMGPSSGEASNAPETPKVSNILDGITVADIDEGLRQNLHIPSQVKGAVVTQIAQESAGYEAGLREGAVIEELNRQPVTSADQAVALSEKVEKTEKVLIRVWYKGGSSYVAVEKK